MKLKNVILSTFLLSAPGMFGVNPYLPLWEHIPDGEPYLFDDPDSPGKKRVYIYGSHDTERTGYCGRDLVVWSASPDSLNHWRYDGVIFESLYDANGKLLNENGKGDVLFAPDIAVKTLPDGRKEYYLYPNVQHGDRGALIAKSDRPDGPFKACNWDSANPAAAVGVLGFDPAVFVDDDGRVYGYWGFGESYGAELDPATMATPKPGSEPLRLLSGFQEDGPDRFYEASSIRKIDDKYVLIFSRWSADGEWGLPGSNYTLAYAYSDNPLGPFTYGGTIIDARGRDTDADGKTIVTATPNGNTHGSILKTGDQWWVFYHRQNGDNEYARQAMVAPIEVAVTPGPGGKVEISEGEYTSEGFEITGLNPFTPYPAAIASHYTGPTPAYQEYPKVHYSGPWFRPLYSDTPDMADPYALEANLSQVVNVTAGSTLGYKYYNFDGLKKVKKPVLELTLIPEGIEGRVKVYASAPWKDETALLGEANLPVTSKGVKTRLSIPLSGLRKLSGKHPLYLVFDSPEKDRQLCVIESLVFKR